MNNLVKKLGKKINGCIKIPGDKSISIRAALISNVFDGDFEFVNFNFCDDTKATLSCIKKLTEIKPSSYESASNKKSIKNKCHTIVLDCKNSATTMRLLTGILVSIYQGENLIFKLIGDESLSKRPMNRIIEPLKKMGADVKGSKNGTAPLIINCKNCHIKNLSYTSKISSAQVKSCLELAAFLAGTKLTYREPYKSRNHTEIMLRYFAELEHKNHHCHHEDDASHKCKHKNCSCRNNTYYIPSDISTATYFIVNALIYDGSKITIKNVLLNPTRTGFLNYLKKMGANYTICNKKLLQGEVIGDISINNKNANTNKSKKTSATSIFKAITINKSSIPAMIDEIPLISILLATANGVSKINGISELKVKESDRLLAITKFLDVIGVSYKIIKDSIKIYGNPNIDLSKVYKNIKNKKSLEHLLHSKDHRILLILKLLKISGIKYQKFLSTSL